MNWLGTRIAILVALLLPGYSTRLQAGARDYQGLPVLEIQFDPVQQPLPKDEIARMLPIQAGDLLDVANVGLAIERLYATGRYEEIAVDATRRDSGVVLRFLTKGAWFVGRLIVDGVPDPPNRGQLIGTAKLDLGSEFHPADLQRAVEDMRQRMQDNGFFEARFQPELSHDPKTQQVHINFHIDPGPRARFSLPQLNGVTAERFNAVVNATNWKRVWGLLGWKTVTESRVQHGLDNIRSAYSKQNNLLNRVTLDEMEYSAPAAIVKPVITVEPGPKVELKISGAKLSARQRNQLIPVYQEKSADRDLLVEGMRNLTTYFRSKGYFRVKVSFGIASGAAGKQTVLYSVDLGDRFKLTELNIAGQTYFKESDIRERLSMLPATRIRFRQGRFSDELLADDLQVIRNLYASNGFLSMKATAETEEVRIGKANHVKVRIHIEEGPQWLVDAVEVRGIDASQIEAIGPLLSSVPQQPYSEVNPPTDRDAVLNYFYNQGFPEASFDWTVADSGPHSKRITYDVRAGPRKFVRGVLIGGLIASDPSMVNERIRVKPGEPLSQARLIESQRRLYDLGVFARVNMAIQNPNGEEESKQVLFEFEEARKYSFNLGVGAQIARIGGGAANFDAPAGSAGFSPRLSLGVSRSNLFGVGHTIGIQGIVSNIQQRAIGTYLAPKFRGRENLSLSASLLYDASFDVRTFRSRRNEGSVQLSRRLSRANTVQGRLTYRRNTVSDVIIDSNLVPIYSRAVRVGIASASFIQDKRDDPIDTRRGYYNTVDFGFASKIFASESDFTRLLMRNSSYHRITGEIILARSTTFGWQQIVGNPGPDGIPLPERFFSGGASTHRGFPDNQAGPRYTETGFPAGGSSLLMNSLELRFPLVGRSLGGIAFHDAGNVYRGITDVSFRVLQRDQQDFNYMVHAVGFGIRYKTPVGPVRFDVSYGPNAPRFSFNKIVQSRISRFQFHFSLGQTF